MIRYICTLLSILTICVWYSGCSHSEQSQRTSHKPHKKIQVKQVRILDAVKTQHSRSVSSAPGGQRLSSVAWSLDGKKIAYVVTKIGDGSDNEIIGPDNAEVMVVDLQKADKIPVTRLALHLDRAQGIPCALFWLDNKHLGWVAAKESGFLLLAADLKTHKPYAISKQKLSGWNTRGYGESFAAPDDAFYDIESHNLIISDADDSRNGGMVVLNLDTDNLRILRQPDDSSLITACGSLKDASKPVIYWAGLTDGDWGLRRSNSYDLDAPKIVYKGGAYMPRLSPDMKRIAWLESAAH